MSIHHPTNRCLRKAWQLPGQLRTWQWACTKAMFIETKNCLHRHINLGRKQKVPEVHVCSTLPNFSHKFQIRQGFPTVHSIMCHHNQTKLMCRNFSTNSSHQSTIFALSSGHGKCGVAVIRVSGSRTEEAIRQIAHDKRNVPRPRHARLQKFYHPVSGEVIDRGLLLWFPGPSSFTGEDCCEFHVHGGPAVVTAMLDALGAVRGLRHADAGEFTKRAFQNNKMDLTQVEGLADLIHAETEAQRQQALQQMEGVLGELYMDWRQQILKCVAHAEAYIDFSEDDNIEDGVMDEVRERVVQIQKDLQRHLSDNRKGERLRSGVHVAIIGEPNVGKSSLLNALCQRPAAIVSPIEGTTRDVVETALNIGGYPVLLSDTAGLRETKDVVEREGVKRALQRASDADLKIVLLDASKIYYHCRKQGFRLQEYISKHLTDLGVHQIMKNSHSASNNRVAYSSQEVVQTCAQRQQSEAIMCDNTLQGYSDVETDDMDFPDKLSVEGDYIIVLNKFDLVDNMEHFAGMEGFQGSTSPCCLSCATEEGMDDFLQILKSKVQTLCGSPNRDNPSLTQARHRAHLEKCHGALEEYLLLERDDIVMAAQQLRIALRHVGKITGKVSSEEVLDVIFRDFCIGK